MPNHDECSMCHAWPQGAYGTIGTWAAGVVTNVGFHGNNKIEMNASAGYTRTAMTTGAAPAYGCYNSCHNDGANANHGLENSNWTFNLVTGPAGGCSGCHGGPSGEWWPVGGIGTTYPRRGGEHQVHIDALALRANTTDVGWKNTTCLTCQPDQGSGYTVGIHDINTGAGALSTTATVYIDGSGIATGFFKNILGSYQLVTGSYDPATKVCANTERSRR